MTENNDFWVNPICAESLEERNYRGFANIRKFREGRSTQHELWAARRQASVEMAGERHIVFVCHLLCCGTSGVNAEGFLYLCKLF